MAERSWIDESDAPAKPTPAQALAFFGIPPDPREELERNIDRKARTWRLKARERRPTRAAKKKIERVRKTIERVAGAARAAIAPAPMRPSVVPRTPAVLLGPVENRVKRSGELLDTVRRLVFQGRIELALRTAYAAYLELDDVAVTGEVLAWIVSLASSSPELAGEPVLRIGAEAGSRARAAGARNAQLHESLMTIALARRLPRAAVGHFEEAQRELGHRGIGIQLLVLACSAYVGADDIAKASDCAQAAAERDVGGRVRRDAVEALIDAARRHLLPITSPEKLEEYDKITRVAAWCALGDAPAEALARPHRLWAAQARTELVGPGRYGPYVTVLFGLLPQPLVHLVVGKPQWAILALGPDETSRADVARIVSSPVVREVHSGIGDRFDWEFSEFAVA